jgi:hypothetical protein
MFTPNRSTPRAVEPKAQRTHIGDIAAVGEELSEEQLRFIDGGAPTCGCDPKDKTCAVVKTDGGKDCGAASD